MDPVLIVLLILMGFMLIGSMIAIETRDLLSSVISVGAVGFGTSLVFLLVGAPDLAITQVVVEILVLVVLVRVVITRRDETHATSRSTLVTGVVLLALGLMCAVVFGVLATSGEAKGLRMRPFGDPLMNEQASAALMAPAGGAPPAAAPAGMQMARSTGGAFLQHGLLEENGTRGTGAANYVMGIVLDYRGYDTLGEATVIFVAIIGAYAILRKVGRSRHAGNVADR
jgi:multisubunit Na+/H+ antiporter MnhB subunit